MSGLPEPIQTVFDHIDLTVHLTGSDQVDGLLVELNAGVPAVRNRKHQ